MFADFDVDEEGRAVLLRISFDGFGCCDGAGSFKKMGIDDSRVLIELVHRGPIVDPKIEAILRAYFRENSDLIWSDALANHELL